MAGWATGPDRRVTPSPSVRRGQGQPRCRLPERDARGSEIRGTSDQPEVDTIRTQNATSIPEPERGPGKLRVRTVPSAGPRPSSDRQDAPRQRRGVGPRLRLGHRSLRSRARPERPHPNGHHRKHEYPNNHGEHHGHRHHPGAPLLALSPSPMPQLPHPLFYHDRDRRPATNNARSATTVRTEGPAARPHRERERSSTCHAGPCSPRGGGHGSRGPAKDADPVSLLSPASRRGGSHRPTGRLTGKTVHYPTLRSRPIRTCQQEPNHCPGFRNQRCAARESVCSPTAG
jgi:hypothetical protein